MKRRILSFMMAVVMLFGAVPVGALAQDAEDSVIHYIDDVLWLPQGEEPTEAVVETGEWILTEETDSKTELVCQNDEHVHKTNCPVDEEGNFVCDGHVHTDACREMVYDHAAHTHTEACEALVWSCGKAESAGHQHASACYTLTCEKTPAAGHAHGDSCRNEAGELTCGLEESAGYQHTSGCYTLSCTVEVGAGAHSHEASECTSAKTCTAEEHTHDENCAAVPGDYACGQEAHKHVTNGCADDCALEAHTHGEECYQTVELAKWIVALKDEGMLMAPIWRKYYNHVDVRVNGEYTGNKGSGNIKIENPSIRVETCLDGENWETVASGSMSYDGANREFRKLNLRLDTTMTRVTLTCDVTFTSGPKAGTTVSGVQVVFASEAALKAANQECPDHSGLDFIVTYEHIEKALYDVVYVWYPAAGEDWELPAGLPALPAGEHEVEEGGSHTIDTKSYGPYNDGEYLYTFGGWVEWMDSIEHTDWEEIGEKTKVPVVGDVTIRGYWTRTKMTGSVAVTKDIAGDLNEDTFKGSVEVALVNAEGKTVATKMLNAANGWNATFENVPVGAYTITETPDDQPGYSYDAEITGGGNVKLTGDGAVVAIVNEYSKMESTEVHNYPAYTVNKQDANAEPLAGAQFTLYADEACSTAVKQVVTGADGVAKFDFNNIDVNFGNANEVTFYLKETKAPIGYKLKTDVTSVTIQKDAAGSEEWDAELGKWVTTYNHELIGEPNSTVVNEALTGSITIKKEFAGDLSAADFEEIILKVSGVEEPVVLNADNNWTTTLSGLPMGTYHITETAGADVEGYTCVFSANSVTLADTTGTNTADLTASVTVTNAYTKKPEADKHIFPSFTLNKINAETKAALAGAEFTLYLGETALTTFTTTGSAMTIDFTAYKDEILAAEGADVIFTLKETKAPVGYILADNEISITIRKGEGNRAFDKNADKWITTYTHTLIGAAEATVQNAELKGEIHVEKQFVGHDGKAVTIKLMDASGREVGTKVLNEAGEWKAVFEDLDLGTYIIVEEDTKVAGYTCSTAITVNGETGSIVRFADTTGKNSANLSAEVVVTNTYTKNVNPENVHEYPTLTVSKEDASAKQALSGAEFTLSGLGKTVTGTTGADGKLVFNFEAFKAELADVTEPVTFTLKETKAPAGYILDATSSTFTLETDVEQVLNEETDEYDNVYTHTLDGKDEISITVDNTALTGSVTINKVFKDLDRDFTGEKVVVQLQGTKGHIQTAELTAENNWTVTLTGLPLDTYTVTEPAGYADQEGYTYAATFSAETVTFAEEAGRSGTYTDNTAFVAAVTVTNTYSKIVGEAPIVTPAGFIIHKVNADNEPLAGAVFTLYQDEACTTVVDATKYPEGFTATAVSGADGKAVFAGLQLHVLKLESQAEGRTEVFYLKESQAPAGYTADNTIYKVQLDEEITIEVWNAEKKLFENFVDWIVNVFNPDGTNALKNGILTVVNEKRETTLTVKKEVVFKYNGEVVTGDAAAALKAEIGNPAYEIVVDIDGKKVTKNLKDGESAELDIDFESTYTITETVADDAKFNVEENEITGTVSVNDLAEGVEVVVTNVYEFESHNEHEDKPGKLMACVEFTKIDAVTKAVLAGAEFGLYDAEGQLVAQDADCVATTGPNGALHFHVTEAGKYTLKEIKAPAGYADTKVEIEINVTIDYVSSTEGDKNLMVEKLVVEGDGIRIENIRNAINLKVTKAWSDGGYYDRPGYVQIQLMKTTAEGKEKVGDHVTLNANNDWTYTWEDLDPYAVWSVEEYAIGKGYTATYSDNEVTFADGTDVTVTVTNTRPISFNDITVTKVWKGSTGKSITVRLYKDGVQYGDAVVITKDDKWTYTWEDMPDTSVYTVKEDRISGYYTKITSDTNGLNWTITNTRSVIPQTGDMIMVTVGVMGVSAVALVVLLLMKRRKYNKN